MKYEAIIRLGAFFGVFAVMALWELAAPRRKLIDSKPKRWVTNLTIVFGNSALLRLVVPVTALGASFYATSRGMGLFNVLSLDPMLEGIICILALDLLIYAQHVVFHIVGPFWRLHRMHHMDLDLDVTSGARFHPIEIVLSVLIKALAVLALGAPAWSVVAFEVLLNATAMFNHSNVRVPEALDRVLRLFVVTPDMHRVHHSVIIKETNSNYGFNLPWWDRLFGTYIAQPEKGHLGMKIGLANYRDAAKLRVGKLLVSPFGGPER